MSDLSQAPASYGGATHDTLHATAVAIGGNAVVLTGRSGSGKSDLALRLIDRGAQLVCDDSTLLQRREGRLYAMASPALAGKIELRGIGICETPFLAEAPVMLIVSLDEPQERFPLDQGRQTLAGIAVPVIRLDAREGSAPIKVEWALARTVSGEGAGHGPAGTQ